jgi:hypothetical protein
MIKSSLIRKHMRMAGCAVVLGLAASLANAADHVDLPSAAGGAVQMRPDASITDFYSFVSGDKLVMIMNLNPFMDPAVQTYQFPTDVSYRFNVDVNSPVTIGNDVVSKEFGGVITRPAGVSEDLVFEVTFDNRNRAKLNVTGSNPSRCEAIRPRARLFTGLRAESFIFAPFVRNNVASIVVEVPVTSVVQDQSKLLLWATTTLDLPQGKFTELGGRALRSQFPPFVGLNALPPSQHVANGFVRPDVQILDTSKPSSFPNGRTLADDVVDEAATFVSLPTDAVAAGLEVTNCSPGGSDFPCPVAPSATAADVRILGRFPYVGRPYRPGERSLTSGDID